MENQDNPPSSVAAQASLDALELPAVLSLVAELAATDLGARRARDLAPVGSREPLEALHESIQEAGRLLDEGSLVDSCEEPLYALLQTLRGDQRAVGGAQLVLLARVLQTGRDARQRVQSAEADLRSLRARLATLPDGEPLRRRIVKCLDKRGGVRDDASAELLRLRRRVHRIRDSLYSSLQQTISRHPGYFTETTISLKDGRLTLLLQAGARGRVPGLIHGRSGTGQSFYFEPLPAVDANNSLQETLEDEDGERRRILAELVGEARSELPLIEAHFELLGELDLLQSIARFAGLADCTIPEFGGGGELVLLQARHPLLEPALAPLRERVLGQAGHTQPVVPLDVELDAECRVLVITGPNAGGKTVALKTIGLLSLMAQCGLPIPAAAGSRLPLFETVMAMLGDEQDLLTDRSTFSARLLRLKEAWEVAGPRSLVLLDELGSGTDPEEGSALAVALLEGLLGAEAMAVVTTHLTRLAATALESDGAACAAMEFDPESGEPTFRLRPGAPGGSQALNLAARLGLPRAWLARAESLLGSDHRDLRRLLREVEEVRGGLAATQAELTRELRALQSERQLVDAERSALVEERNRLAASLRKELADFRRKVTERLRDELAKMQRELGSGRRKGLVSAAVQQLFEDEPDLAESPGRDEGPVAVGATVRHRSFGWSGRLEEIRGEIAELVVHGKRVQCALADLMAVRENERVESRRKPTVELGVPDDGQEEDGAELNLIGQRVEPALESLDRFLDRALLSSRGEVRVVHGFGSGRLRTAVRNHLRTHPAVEVQRPGRPDEGGDGATVVTLAKG